MSEKNSKNWKRKSVAEGTIFLGGGGGALEKRNNPLEIDLKNRRQVSNAALPPHTERTKKFKQSNSTQKSKK
jgi:hypothetical protein